MWKHDDTLRQQRIGNFLTVNTILLVALSAFTGIRVSIQGLAAIAIAFSVFGLLICLIWKKVNARNAEYVRFRRFQLRAIEAQLDGLTTFANTYSAFYSGDPVEFPELADRFEIAANARSRSTFWEGRLPVVLGWFWAIAGASAAGTLLFTHLG